MGGRSFPGMVRRQGSCKFGDPMFSRPTLGYAQTVLSLPPAPPAGPPLLGPLTSFCHMSHELQSLSLHLLPPFDTSAAQSPSPTPPLTLLSECFPFWGAPPKTSSQEEHLPLAPPLLAPSTACNAQRHASGANIRGIDVMQV